MGAVGVEPTEGAYFPYRTAQTRANMHDTPS